MCWNRAVSAAACAVAWATCAVLRWRDRPRDRWYALYLATYPLTQVIDIVLWTYHEAEGLEGCPSRRFTFSVTPPHQLGPFLVSKYAIPAVVFVQYWAQLRYPSPRNLALRKALLALYGAAAIAMAFQSACTDVIRARWPRAHDTLRWGGYDGAAAPILVVAALTAGNFAVCVEREHPRILAALVLPFVGVITFLWSTEGTLALGSKWCTYCLIYAVLFLAAPLWDGSRAATTKGDGDKVLYGDEEEKKEADDAAC